jgi:hypothetical protein
MSICPRDMSIQIALATTGRPADCRTYRVSGVAAPKVSAAISSPSRATAT